MRPPQALWEWFTGATPLAAPTYAASKDSRSLAQGKGCGPCRRDPPFSPPQTFCSPASPAP